MERFIVEYYHKLDGSCPIKEFMDDLDEKTRARVLRLQMLLAYNGNELREPYSKPLEEGIFELRTQQGNNIVRSLYFFMSGKKVIITNGFVKKTQKTPRREIETAKRYRADYLKREGDK